MVSRDHKIMYRLFVLYKKFEALQLRAAYIK